MKVVVITVILVLSYAIFNYLSKTKKIKTSNKKSSKNIQLHFNNTQNEVIAYIEHVINNGSSRFDFPGGVMEGGYIPKDKANDVACYVYELSDRKCNRSYAKDAALYFSSSCASCHGIDAKGVNGSYPNLTKNPLLGIKNTSK